MVILIDNYDSFTYNVYHSLAAYGVAVHVIRNNYCTAQEVINRKPRAIVLSPGPCTPNEAGMCLPLIALNNGRIPLLGVCLGHQSIAQSYGGHVVRAPQPVHGKTDTVYATQPNHALLAGLPESFTVARYHSLVADAATLPNVLQPIAHTADGLIMALAHRTQPVYGVQFHPESYATPQGSTIIGNFLKLANVLE